MFKAAMVLPKLNNYNVVFVARPKATHPTKVKRCRTQCWAQKYSVLFLTLLLVVALLAVTSCDAAESPPLGADGSAASEVEVAYDNLQYSSAAALVDDDATAFVSGDYINSLDRANGPQMGVFGYGGSDITPLQFYSNTPYASPISRSPLHLSSTVSASELPHYQAANSVDRDLTSWNLLAESASRVDICTVCQCVYIKNRFATITCDFQQNRKLSEIFGANYRVPQEATSITIKLAAETHFRLEQGFFTNNTVNSLSIEGAHRNGEQVEITTGAFFGNNGPYPELQMLNIFSVIVREKAFAGNSKFTVRNSNDLILYSNAFENAKINGHFVGIKDLRIEEKAFNSGQARLRIEASHIDNIYRFEASLREIRFINCTIGTINSGTFDVININSIVFENCRIDVIKTRAITEKLYSKHVSITGAIIGSIEGKAIYGSGISELNLTKNQIDTIHEHAIHVTAINATISYNHIKHLGNNWLRIKDWSNIIIEKNRFGDFGRMLLEETKTPLTCRFDGNSLTRPMPGSLNLTSPLCIMREISIDKPCSCHLTWLHELSMHDLRSETYCTIDAKLGSCFHATTFNALKYLNEVCDDRKTTLDCVANRNLKKVDGKFFTPEELEHREKYKFIYIIGSVLLVLICVGIIIILWFFCCGRRCTSNRTSMADDGIQHQHTFSQDEINQMDNTLMVIQKKHPEINDRVRRLVQKLQQPNLSKEKCDKIIGKIEDSISKVDKCRDLNAFSNLLVQHMQPHMPTAPPCRTFVTHETYDGIHYAVSGRVGEDNDTDDNGRLNEQSNMPNEPFYEELGQPLLCNGYALPADRSDYDLPNDRTVDLNMGEYAEPINDRGAYAQRIPPYATAAIRQIPPIPPVSASSNSTRNAADPLPGGTNGDNRNRVPSAPLTKVQRIANDLQRNPNFLLGDPRQRNLHLLAPVVYTTPDVSHKRSTPSDALPIKVPVPTPRLASPELDDIDFYNRSTIAVPPDGGSDHSGGSKETVKIDDVIEYVDA